MLIIVTYDVSTSSSGGQKRLRKVAKICQNHGQRVQNSVFECIVNTTQYTILKNEILSIMDTEKDSIRFYRLSDNHHSKVEHFGVKESLDLEGPLIF
ncbi:CRISPR-associated endonuclease Cas2 [Oceanobacillus jeddahense]|uniref:CRISPR-associated endonuclease Cas2 n=1 Tax=Oceanobacillus jeddahense TaxID=1462527 RepID=UPI000595E6C1|nr:CRISPR-associated endonuclease Cas2 [Oceanobacillus jeddahense]